jgi:hypothetical protein
LKSLILKPEAYKLGFQGGVLLFIPYYLFLNTYVIDSSKNYKCFLHLGYILTIGNVEGIMQMTMGVDFAEQEWLNEGRKHIFSLETKSIFVLQ